MPRDLADVLHFFLPELDASGDEPAQAAGAFLPELDASGDELPQAAGAFLPELDASGDKSPQAAAVAELPVIGIPMGERDVVRAALTWNLSVEIARLGGQGIVLAPASPCPTPLWPEAGTGPLGSELLRVSVTSLSDLARTARQVAAEHFQREGRRGALFVRVPPEWLESETGLGQNADAIRSWLLITSSHRRQLEEAFEWARRIQRKDSKAHIGATIHGVTTIAEARRAFEHLSTACQAKLGTTLNSYGLLVDDLDVYRAIASQRPIGLAHPQAPATRALMDVAQLLDEDVRSRRFA